MTEEDGSGESDSLLADQRLGRTGLEVRLDRGFAEGRYGLYLNDGVTNASLPKGVAPDSVTKEQALELLAARAALGPPKKKPSRRKPPAKPVLGP